MPEIVILRRAQRDWQKATRWYRKQDIGLANRFVERVQTLLDRIAEDPSLGQLIFTEYRFRRVHRFPYVVYYSIHSSHVLIVAIIHERRLPGRWMTET